MPYNADSVSVFSRFAHQPYAVFLDSGGKARFDVIAANPCHVISVKDLRQDPFDLTQQMLADEATPANLRILEELPFTIGAIGYFSYPLGFPLANLTPSSLPDVSLPAAVVGFYDWSVVIDHHLQATYLISREQQSAKLNTVKDLLLRPAPCASGHFSLTGDFSPNMDKNQYAAAFAQIKRHICAGDCYQINLAQRFSATFEGTPWIAYQRLRAQNPMPMSAFMNLGKDAVLCLSPERFLQVTNGQVVTQPIKGTSPRFADTARDQQSAQSLLSSVKDRAENIMIVDLLRNDLSKCCRPGSVKVPQLCTLESFANVHHLISTVTGFLEKDQHPLDLLKYCFPGGSITGAPKRRAMQIIDQLEPCQRSLYCGSIAYCDVRGRMDSNIAIRTLLCNENKIYCYGGGGIVNDSTMESEYAEIQFKISKLLTVIATNL